MNRSFSFPLAVYIASLHRNLSPGDFLRKTVWLQRWFHMTICHTLLLSIELLNVVSFLNDYLYFLYNEVFPTSITTLFELTYSIPFPFCFVSALHIYWSIFCFYSFTWFTWLFPLLIGKRQHTGSIYICVCYYLLCLP